MPPGSRTACAWGFEPDLWSRDQQLLAGLFDAVQRLDYVFRAAWHDPKKPPPEPPEPLVRPGVARPTPPSLQERLSALTQ